jgi:hypothetical protein
MKRKTIVSSVVLASSLWLASPSSAGEKPSLPGGELKILNPDGTQVGVCPLKHSNRKIPPTRSS